MSYKIYYIYLFSGFLNYIQDLDPHRTIKFCRNQLLKNIAYTRLGVQLDPHNDH